MIANIEEMGLRFIESDYYNKIFVKDWRKFFPFINLPMKGPLAKLAKEHWFTLATFRKSHDAEFFISIRGVDAHYNKSLYKLSIFKMPEEDFLAAFCPYDADDVRRYVWLNTLNQFDYAKICDDILKVLINIIKVKYD